MKALRLKIFQKTANYKIAEAIGNRITYPLVPPSTIIGAIHSFCNWSELHSIEVSIQGYYETKSTEMKKLNCFLNDNERGTIIKLPNPYCFNNGFKNIDSNKVSIEKNELDTKLEFLEAKSKNSNLSKKEEEIITKEIKHIENELEYYKNFVSCPTYFEILNCITTIIHIKGSEVVLNEIYNNLDNFYCLGRSEDTISLEEAIFVDLNNPKETIKCQEKFTQYIPLNKVENNFYRELNEGYDFNFGTVFKLPKTYHKHKDKRIFEYNECILLNNYELSDNVEDIYIDNDNYIVCFI